MDYIWTKKVIPLEFSDLDGDSEIDILIIGGMAGVLCALKLLAAWADYILLEAKLLGEAITKGTTAVLTAKHDTLYQEK